MSDRPDRIAVVIEDDADIRNLLEAILEQAGFTTIAVSTGSDGVQAVRDHQPILTTLDISLPGIDGFEVARQIRMFSMTYIIMLSARAEEIDTLMGLDAGADDYLTKPFRPRELRARIEAMLRRSEAGGPLTTEAPSIAGGSLPALQPEVEGVVATETTDTDWLVHDNLRVNVEMRLCELDGIALNLTRTEFDLLYAIMARNHRVISKHELALEIRGAGMTGGYVSESDQRAVEVHLANLRRKLNDPASEPHHIETVRGVGYRLARLPR